jgi:hypothetical protein
MSPLIGTSRASTTLPSAGDSSPRTFPCGQASRDTVLWGRGFERGELATIDAVARFVEALSGRRDLIASFGDHTLTVTTAEAA